MSYQTPREKKSRSLHLRQRILKSTSTDHKRRISSLLKNNKTLANTLEETRKELSDVKNSLEARHENSTKIMILQNKMLHMHSTLKLFVKDFDETLQFLKEDDTSWPTLGHIIKSRTDFKDRMQNVIDPVEEVSERESFLDPGNTSLRNKKLSVSSTPIASNSRKTSAVLETEPRKSGSLATINEDVVNCQQQKNKGIACEKSANLNTDTVLSALPCVESNGAALLIDVGKKHSDGILQDRKMEVSPTPALCFPCPSTKSVININSSHPSETSSSTQNISVISSVNSSQLIQAKISKIPKFLDLPVVKSRLNTAVKRENLRSVKELTKNPVKAAIKSNLAICKMSTDSDITEKPSSNTAQGVNKCSDPEVNLIACDLEGAEAEDCSRRKTFVVKKVEESQSNRRKTFVKKICKTDARTISNKNKRQTFVVSKSDDKVGLVNEEENCSVSVNNLASDSVIKNENLPHSVDVNKGRSSISVVAPVLNTTVTACSIEEFNNNQQSTERLSNKNQNLATADLQECHRNNEQMVNIPVINCEESSAISSKENAKKLENCAQSTESLANAFVISAENCHHELLENDLKEIPAPEISCKKASTMHSEIQCNAISSDTEAISDQNAILQPLLSRKENMRGKQIQSAELNVHECHADSKKNLTNEKEFSHDSDITSLPAQNVNRNSSAAKQQQAASDNLEFSSHLDVEISNIDFDLNFHKDIPLLKDPPIRGQISKNKPLKVFVFQLNKNESTLSKNEQNKLPENSLKNQYEVDTFTHRNNDIVNNMYTEDNQYGTANFTGKEFKKRKHLQFATDTAVKENNVCNVKSQTQTTHPKSTGNEEQKATNIRKNKKSVGANKSKAKVSSVLSEEDTHADYHRNVLPSNDKTTLMSDQATESQAKTTHSKSTINEKQKVTNIRKNKNNVGASKSKAKVSSVRFEDDINANCHENKLPNGKNTLTSDQTKDNRKSNEHLAISEMEGSSFCLSSEIHTSCQSDKFSNTNKMDNQIKATINNDSVKIPMVEIHQSYVENTKKAKPKKVKRKRKAINDSILIEDCLTFKKNKRSNTEKVDNADTEKVDTSDGITSDITEKSGNFDNKCARKETKSKRKYVKKKVKKTNEDVPSKNVIIVQAEIHPPPMFASKPLLDFSPKENFEDCDMKTRRLSIILSDIFQSSDVSNLNISGDKELLLSKQKTQSSSKVPLSENFSNMQSTSIAKNVTKEDQNVHYVDEIQTGRRRRAQNVCYKEPSLSQKMRR